MTPYNLIYILQFQTAGKSELKALLAKAREKTGEKNEADEVL